MLTCITPVDGEVEPYEVGELLVLVSHHLSEIVRPVLVRVDGADTGAVLVDVTVHEGSDRGQLGDQVHRILVEVLQTRFIYIVIQTGFKLNSSFAKQHSDSRWN